MTKRSSVNRHKEIYPVYLLFKNIGYLCCGSNPTDSIFTPWLYAVLCDHIKNEHGNLCELKKNKLFPRIISNNRIVKPCPARELYKIYEEIKDRNEIVTRAIKNNKPVNMHWSDSITEKELCDVLLNLEFEAGIEKYIERHIKESDKKNVAVFSLKYVFPIAPSKEFLENHPNVIISKNYVALNNAISTLKRGKMKLFSENEVHTAVIFDDLKDNGDYKERYSTINYYTSYPTELPNINEIMKSISKISGTEKDGDLLASIAHRLPSYKVSYEKYPPTESYSTVGLHKQAIDYLVCKLGTVINDDTFRKKLMKIVDQTGYEIEYSDDLISESRYNIFKSNEKYGEKLTANMFADESLLFLLHGLYKKRIDAESEE